MLPELTTQRIGLIAGFIVMSSTAPDFIENILTPELAAPGKIMRDSAACIGNSLWVWFGFRAKQPPIKIFCSLAALMLGCLVLQQLWMLLTTST